MLLKDVCKALDIYIDKEWRSNHGDIYKVTKHGKLLLWNGYRKEWMDYSWGWSDILSGVLVPIKEESL